MSPYTGNISCVCSLSQETNIISNNGMIWGSQIISVMTYSPALLSQRDIFRFTFATPACQTGLKNVKHRWNTPVMQYLWHDHYGEFTTVPRIFSTLRRFTTDFPRNAFMGNIGCNPNQSKYNGGLFVFGVKGQISSVRKCCGNAVATVKIECWVSFCISSRHENKTTLGFRSKFIPHPRWLVLHEPLLLT